MLKWLFAALLLANIGLLMWGSWYHEPLVSPRSSEPEPDIAPTKLKQLSEPGVRLVPRSRSASSGAPEATACYRLGPFRSPEATRVAAERLTSWGLSFERTQEFETHGVIYQLYLPAFPTREAAEAKRRQLTELGFTDHAIVQEDEVGGYPISLGLFAVEHNAQQRLDQLLAKGIEASIQRVPRLRALFWLALRTPIANDQIGGVPLNRFTEEDWGSAEVGLKPGLCISGAVPNS
jgi:hypothetical protein